jgi:hypothetical protein
MRPALSELDSTKEVGQLEGMARCKSTSRYTYGFEATAKKNHLQKHLADQLPVIRELDIAQEEAQTHQQAALSMFKDTF